MHEHFFWWTDVGPDQVEIWLPSYGKAHLVDSCLFILSIINVDILLPSGNFALYPAEIKEN